MINKKNLVATENYYFSLVKLLNKIKIPEIEGSLIIDNKNNSYYHKYVNPEGLTVRKYISKNEKWKISALANKSYLLKVKKLVEKRLKQVRDINSNFQDNEVSLILSNLHPLRQVVIDPIEPSWQDTLKKWKDLPQIATSNPFPLPNIVTNKGERVRSKSEKIIADLLYSKNIEYKYECPLQLPNGELIYQDFTLLNPNIRKEVYWEHFGLLSDSNYLTRALSKIIKYEKNGIFRFSNLIITFENPDLSLDLDWISHILTEYLN